VASEMAVRGHGRRVSRLLLIDAIGPGVPAPRKRLGRDSAEITALADHLTAHAPP
jgi:hypothetical protein